MLFMALSARRQLPGRGLTAGPGSQAEAAVWGQEGALLLPPGWWPGDWAQGSSGTYWRIQSR